MIKQRKFINYRYIICIIITLIFIALSLNFSNCFNRLFDGLKDLWNSFRFYFCELFEIEHEIEVSVVEIPKSLEDVHLPFLPKNWETFLIKMEIYCCSLWNLETLFYYSEDVITFILNTSKLILIFSPLLIILYIQYQQTLQENDKEKNSDSKPLKLYYKFEKTIILPIYKWLISFKNFLLEKKYFLIIWCLIWALYFNFFTIIIEALSYYFYFVLSFDFLNLYIQIYKLLLDLVPIMEFIPPIGLIIISYIIYELWRRNLGYKILRHYELRNRGFINTLGQVSMTCGAMGTGKTTALTDMALSQAHMFRDKALELILLNDLKFPNFPYINFEKELKVAMEHHEIYNLATARLWVRKKKYRFENSAINKRFIKKKKYEYKKVYNKKKIFDYDYEKYGLIYNDNLKIINIFEMLENYAQEYFIYIINSSYLVSNFSIREDDILKDLGNFPIWHNDFFKTNPNIAEAYSRHAHILDFDMLRLGKKIIENNIKANAFEFGVIVITEGGKERKNMLELKELKKNVDETNQKNDLFNMWLKMARHSATVDNFPFIKVMIDEQRPESMGADVRELCEKIVFIREKEETKNTLFLFGLDVIIYEFFESRFKDYYLKYRYYRSDNTLLLYLFKKIFVFIHNRYIKLKNTFGFNRLLIESEKGTLDNQFENHKYYIMHKKIYSCRFATDAFSDFFVQKSLNSYMGLNDLQTYRNVKASLDELKIQNSYFINDLTKHTKED